MAHEFRVKHPASITTLLQTKLHQPHITRQLAPRPQLWERLDRGLEGQLIAVATSAACAPTDSSLKFVHRICGFRPKKCSYISGAL